ncbi:hypothetical protein NJL88_37335 [Streptomyces sp. DK15]|uniref:hypothetical protein n=1 Tax=Streptomyces sp. DK15 TaxID=2957499 RepID=UPI0029A90081|nr:hypothetical protein [Streptomyces sp. DK15]MDX2395627.1 hypothetical protein [Streptomyces sp. DK15]
MSTGRWLIVSLLRHVLTTVVGWTAASLVLPVLGDGPFTQQLWDGMRVGLVMVPLIALGTLFVLTLLHERRLEPPDGGAARIRGGWTLLLPLAPLFPAALLAPLQYAILLCAQAVYVVWVLPREDSRATARDGVPGLPVADGGPC